MGKNNSRNKKRNKQPLVFAKNKKQATIAMVVLALFGLNTIYTIIKIYNQNNPPAPAAQSTPSGEKPSPLAPRGQNLNQQATSSDPASVALQNQNVQQDANNIYSQTVGLQKDSSAKNPQSAPSVNENDVDIIQKKSTRKINGKMVMISVSNSGRQDPFLPSSDGTMSIYSDLTPPPQTLPSNTDASKIMTTTISGILYDKYSPSAIINIEGTDYLVKRGDVINKYKILSIGKSQVAVQLGRNIYKAGVGELLSQTSFNDGNIPNLNKRFGGNDVSINVRRKGY